MVRLIYGDNSFEIARSIGNISKSFDGEVEKLEGEQVQLSDLPNLLMGTSLFSQERLVIIKNLSENKALWSDFGAWLDRISDDVDLVLIENKLDKRTATYKILKQKAELIEMVSWTERDTQKAEQWLQDYATSKGVTLNNKLIQYLIQRVGLNQWNLSHSIDKLALSNQVDIETINNIIDFNPTENVFMLFETALAGNTKKLRNLLNVLEKTEDPFMLFSLLSSQTFQLSAMSYAEGGNNTEKDFGIHPYVAKKLRMIANRMGKTKVRKTVAILAQADDDMKLSVADPWLLIERALVKITTI